MLPKPDWQPCPAASCSHPEQSPTTLCHHLPFHTHSQSWSLLSLSSVFSLPKSLSALLLIQLALQNQGVLSASFPLFLPAHAEQQGSVLATPAEDNKLPRPFAIRNKPPFSTATQTDSQVPRGSAPETAFASPEEAAGLLSFESVKATHGFAFTLFPWTSACVLVIKSFESIRQTVPVFLPYAHYSMDSGRWRRASTSSENHSLAPYLTI